MLSGLFWRWPDPSRFWRSWSIARPTGAYIATAIYLATLVLSISISAVYNVWPVSPVKLFLRRFDHSAIYLLIAGTYTPFMAKSGTWWLLAFVWAIAVAGVLLKFLMPNRFDRLSIGLYLALGWSGVAAYHEFAGTLSASILWLILIGGLVYSFGVIFHVVERLPFHNAIWHGFVLVAASIHYAAVCSDRRLEFIRRRQALAFLNIAFPNLLRACDRSSM